MPDLISHNSTRILVGISKLERFILFNQKDYNIINDSWVFPKMLKGVPTEIAVRFSSEGAKGSHRKPKVVTGSQK